MSAPNIEIALMKDWAKHLRSELAADGVHLPASISDHEVCVKYYGYQMRFPVARPRTIHKPPGFACPPLCAKGLAQLEKKISAGDDLRPHLSKGAVDLNRQDKMLLEWGIYHFHLGETTEPKDPRYIARTGNLLYARLTTNDAYIIGVFSHGAWSNDDLVRVLHDNWPDSIQNFRFNGVQGLARQFSPADRTKLRNADINSAIEISPGVVYGSLGGGFALSGDSASAVLKSNRCHHWFTDAERRVRESAPRWTVSAKNPTGWFRFQLEISGGSFYAVDAAQDVRLNLGVPS
ncbi:MAG: hypothetical protein M3128_07330 [Verrucomicrobiota bacterium]|nr:hypothetical protein [Verrucomicrobiota bacterium]